MENNSNVVILAVNSSTQDLLASIRSFKAAGVRNIMMFDSAKYGFAPVLDASVKLFHTDKALLDEIKKLDGFVYITRRFNAPKDFVKIAFNDSRKETDAYGFTGYKLLKPVDERIPNVEVEWYNRKPNAPRYLKNDSGDVAVDFFPETGFMVHSSKMADLCKAGVLRVFDSHVTATMAFKEEGMRLVCMNSPWGRPVRLSTRNSGRKYLKADEILAIRKETKQAQCTATNKKIEVEPETVQPKAGKVIIGLASYPPRENGMLMTVRSLCDQCDMMYVALNGYQEAEVDRIRRKVQKENVVFTGYCGEDDLGCQNKFRAVDLCGEDDYFVTVDDDIFYPPDYVEKLLAGIDRNGYDTICGFHGNIFHKKDGKVVPDHKDKTILMYSGALEHDTEVNLLGMGVSVMKPKKIGVTFDLFKVEKNTGDDELVAMFAEQRGIKKIALRKGKNWLSAYIPSTHGYMLCKDEDNRRKRDELLSLVEFKDLSDHTMRIVYIADRGAFTPLIASLESLRTSVEQYGEKAMVTILAENPWSELYLLARAMSSASMRINIRSLTQSLMSRCKEANRKTNALRQASATSTALAKFELGSLFPEYNKLLFIDCDTLITGDLSELFDLLNDNIACVVQDIGYITLKKATGIKKPRAEKLYFNSGVMLLNLKKMRFLKTADKLWDAKERCLDQTLVDQNAFNMVFVKAKRVDPKFNFLVTSLAQKNRFRIEDVNDLYSTNYDSIAGKGNSIYNSAVVMHFAGCKKPWNVKHDDEFMQSDHFKLWHEFFNSGKTRMESV